MSDSTTVTGTLAETELERVRAEMKELLDAQRKLCHNINNPLTAIMGRAQIMQLRQESDPHVIKMVQVVEESAKRVTTYVRELSSLIEHGRILIDGR